MRQSILWLAIAGCAVAPQAATAQLGFGQSNPQKPVASPLSVPTLSPGVVFLMELEGKFNAAVEKGGGKVFASWFADDAVVLNNGRAATLGKLAISEQAKWDPKEYQLSWQPQGAQMLPSGDAGFTWGHYEGHSKDKNGQEVVVEGRYITLWKKVNGEWKVAMDASANDAPIAGECCTLPKPGAK